jgi:hypothetical protein
LRLFKTLNDWFFWCTEKDVYQLFYSRAGVSSGIHTLHHFYGRPNTVLWGSFVILETDELIPMRAYGMDAFGAAYVILVSGIRQASCGTGTFFRLPIKN